VVRITLIATREMIERTGVFNSIGVIREGVSFWRPARQPKGMTG